MSLPWMYSEFRSVVNTLFGTLSWMALDQASQATVLCDPLTTHFVGLGHFPKLLRPTEIIVQGIIIDGRTFLCSKIFVEPITILLLCYAYDQSLD